MTGHSEQLLLCDLEHGVRQKMTAKNAHLCSNFICVQRRRDKAHDRITQVKLGHQVVRDMLAA
jgi:hypothetical protein